MEADKTTTSLQAPTNLASDWISEAWAELKWDDNSIDETEYLIERCTGSGCSSFVQIDSLLSPAGNQLLYRMSYSSL